MIRLYFCNLLIYVGFPEFLKSVMYAGVGVPNETDLRLCAHLGFLLGSEYNKVSHSHCTLWIHSGTKEVLVSCHLNNWIINYLLSSFWVLIFRDQIWLFLLFKSVKASQSRALKTFTPKMEAVGSSKLLLTICLMTQWHDWEDLRLICVWIRTSSVTQYPVHPLSPVWQHKFMIWQIRVPSLQKYSWWYQVMT